jgi:hypothetical protein
MKSALCAVLPIRFARPVPHTALVPLFMQIACRYDKKHLFRHVICELGMPAATCRRFSGIFGLHGERRRIAGRKNFRRAKVLTFPRGADRNLFSTARRFSG